MIRAAHKNDATAIYEISVLAHTQSYYDQLIPNESMQRFLDHYRVSTHRRQRFISSINRKIDDQRWAVIVAEIDHQVVGYTLAYQPNAHLLQLKGLFVAPDYHAVGVGGKLFDASLRVNRMATIVQLLVIDANHVAKSIYLKRGFRVTGRSPKKFFGAKQDVMECTNVLLTI